jgi:hypothetical protein
MSIPILLSFTLSSGTALLIEKLRHKIPEKRRLLARWFLQEQHGDTSQKTTFFIVTAVKTSNLTQYSCMGRLLMDAIDDSKGCEPRRLSYYVRSSLAHHPRFL